MLLTLVRGVGGRIIKYLTVTYTRVGSGLPHICCCTLHAADPDTWCGCGRIIKYLTVIQELEAVYPLFVFAPYTQLTLVRGLGGTVIIFDL